MTQNPPDDLPAEEVGACLTIDLAALKANWRMMAERADTAECGAVVKADAYGTGISQASSALRDAGCRTFFVALPFEALRVRRALPDAVIYVLGGLPPGGEDVFVDHAIRPVLNTPNEIETWATCCRRSGLSLPAAVQLDTGMNRLGLSEDELEALPHRKDLLDAFEISLVMSHLACADTPEHPMNARQAERFDALRGRLPDAPASLANSGGTLIGEPFLHDVARPGIALYGGRALADRPNPMRPVVKLEARIIQTRRASAGEGVGYGLAETLKRDSRLAVLAAGYGDGYLRAAGSTESRPGARVHVGGYSAPLVGRVSMDVMTADVSDIPEDLVMAGSYAQLLGSDFTVDDLADCAGTIGYEVLTDLGRRYRRVYRDG